MLSIENLSDQGNTSQLSHRDHESFWGILEPLLQEQGVEPIDHIQNTVTRWDKEIEHLPASVFDPAGGLNSPLLHTHRVLLNVLGERQPFSEQVAREVFPYWLEQRKDVEDFLEGR